MQIRAARLDDADAIAACFTASVHTLTGEHYDAAQREAWAPQPPDLEEWRERLRQHPALVAVDGESVLGFLVFQQDGHIDMLYCDPSAARSGVATRLYQQAEALLAEADSRELSTEASLVARPFFERQGFHVVAAQRVERRGVWFDRFAMRKRLPPAATAARMNTAYGVALVCWAVPLVLGVGIFVTWTMTGLEWLQFAGACNIYLGLILLAVGLLSLLADSLALTAMGVPRRTRVRRVLLTGGLLLSNLPVAYGVIALVDWIGW